MTDQHSTATTTERDLFSAVAERLQLRENSVNDFRQTAGACPSCGDEAGGNPHFSVHPTEGWICHKTGARGSVRNLAAQIGVAPDRPPPKRAGKSADTSELAAKVWTAATCSDEDWRLICAYLDTRGLPLATEQAAALRAHGALRVSRYTPRGKPTVTSIVYPIVEIDADGTRGELVRKIGRIEVDAVTGAKIDKKQLGRIAEHDNAYRFDPFPDVPPEQKPAVVFEGLEDALTAWWHDPATPRVYLVASSWTGIERCAGFLAHHPSAAVVCDPDAPWLDDGKGGQRPHLPSLQGALALKAKAGDSLQIRIPRLTGEDGKGLDANAAHKLGKYAEWKASLTAPTAEELEIAAAALATKPPPRLRVDGTAKSGAPEFTELAVARDFMSRHLDVLRFTNAFNGWQRYSDGRWAQDIALGAFGLATDHCEALSARLAASDNPDDYKTAKSIATRRFISAVESIARGDARAAMHPHLWDADPWAYNTAGGLVDLNTGTLQPPRADHYCMKQSPAVPTPGGCPLWLRFLDTVTQGDVEFQAFLQRVAGYCLTGSTREEVFFFIYGMGANGKSTFINTLKHVMGDYATTAPMELFTAGKYDPHSSDVAALKGARMVTAIETEQGRRWSEARIKSLTGSDPVRARMLYQEPFEFQPQLKLVVVGNHKPALRNVDEAMRRRLVLLPFTASIPREERNPILGELLKEEAGGILAWALDGCLAWKEDGLRPPRVVQEATAEYFEGEDSLGRWMVECTIEGNFAQATAKSLYDSYKKWADDNGEYVPSQRRFATALVERGHRKEHKERGATFVGIGLKVDAGSQGNF